MLASCKESCVPVFKRQLNVPGIPGQCNLKMNHCSVSAGFALGRIVPLKEQPEGLSPVTACRLFLWRQFGKRAAQFRKQKKRIIAEPSAASRDSQHLSPSPAGKAMDGVSIAGHGNHADVFRRKRTMPDPG